MKKYLSLMGLIISLPAAASTFYSDDYDVYSDSHDARLLTDYKYKEIAGHLPGAEELIDIVRTKAEDILLHNNWELNRFGIRYEVSTDNSWVHDGIDEQTLSVNLIGQLLFYYFFDDEIDSRTITASFMGPPLGGVALQLKLTPLQEPEEEEWARLCKKWFAG